MSDQPLRADCLRRVAFLLGMIVAPSLSLRADDAGRPAGFPPLPNRQPLTVGAFTDAYPYSYLEPDGHLAGFAVDLLDAVARAVGLRIERVSGPAEEIRPRFQRGEFAMLQYHGIPTASVDYGEFSVPTMTFQGSIYVRAGGPVRNIGDLNGRIFGVVGTTGLGQRLLRDKGVGAQIVQVASQEAMLEKLTKGDIDGCFLSQLTELALARRLQLSNISKLGGPYSGYEIRQGFAVHRGDSELLARLNEGLAIVHQSGEYDRIYRKNFSGYGSYLLTTDEVELYASVVLALGFAFALWGYFRQSKLRRALSIQASKLAEQGALLKALYDNIPVAMTVIDATAGPLRVLSMNRQACRLYSVEFIEPGGTLESLPVSDEIRRHLAEAACPPPGVPLPVGPHETVLKAGRRILEVTSVPLAAPGAGDASRTCVFVEDITERRKQEAEIVRSRKLRAVGELVGGIAHEFNNLLTPVMLKAGEIQLARPADEELQREVEVITKAVQRTAELTRRLLTFGRKAEHSWEAVLVAETAASCFDLLKNTVDRRIRWEYLIPADLPPLYINATDLNQILMNLLLNARDALMERIGGRHPADWAPTVTLEAKQLPAGTLEAPAAPEGKELMGWQLITVRDNGLGMPQDVVERIFEPFFTTKDVGKGTGLGLATVWHLTHDAGGQIKVESTPGSGSAFQIYLPVWPATMKPAPEAITPAAPKATSILLVEDETLVAQSVLQLLGKQGHRVRHFENGAEAWSHLETSLTSYALLIIDVNLPGMSGVDIVARARARDFRGRIFMMSGRFTPTDMSTLTRLRIDGSIAKPFNGPHFLAAVQACLAGGDA